MSDMNGQKSVFFNNYCRKKIFPFYVLILEGMENQVVISLILE
jgi:hypothetical protein